MIRAAKADDVSAITDLLVRTIGGTQNDDQVRTWISDPDRVVLVDPEIRGVILGLCMGSEAEITDVAVSTRFRRAGLGRALVRAFIDVVQRRASKSVFLEVRASNVAALSLYDGEGFASVGRRPRYYGDGEDALVLRWEAR